MLKDALIFAQNELAPLVLENPDFKKDFEQCMSLLIFKSAKDCPAKKLLEFSHL